MILVKNMVLVLQKSKQAKTRADLRKKSPSKNWIDVSRWGFENSMSRLQLDALTIDTNLIQTGKFRATWIVGH